MELVAIGDINWDVVLFLPKLPGPDGEVEVKEIQEAPGGDAANVATAFARLGGNAGMVGAVGKDSVGQFLINHLTASGVDTKRVLIMQGPSGRAFSLVEPGGTRRLLYTRGANALRELTEDDLWYLKDSRWLYIADPLPKTVETLSSWYRTEPNLPRLALDPGSAGAARGIDFIAPILNHLSVLFLNESEACAITGYTDLGEAVKALRAVCPLVVVKRGERGALVVGEEELVQPAFPVQAVDTTGCGDAFNAAFLLRLVRGGTVRDAARWGAAAGALVAIHPGAYAPSRQELEEFLLRHREVI